ncbi:MAG: BrxE family protein, partial [Thermoleophilia bacterium]
MSSDEEARVGETEAVVRLVLGVARLGESDLFGWWRSRGLGEAGRYVLGGWLPRTWQRAALE